MSRDKCYECEAYVPEGRQICPACEKAATLGGMDKTAEGMIRICRPAIIRAARTHPAKAVDQRAVYELGRIGLAAKLALTAETSADNLGHRQQLIQAIAETRVLIERLAILHCSTAQDADAYRFYLEMAAKANDPGRPGYNDGHVPLYML